MSVAIFRDAVSAGLYPNVDPATAVLVSSVDQGDGTTRAVVSTSSTISTRTFVVIYNAVGRAQVDEVPGSPVIITDHVLNGPTVDPQAGAALVESMRARLIAERPGINTAQDADHALYLLMAAAIGAVVVEADNTFTPVSQ